MWENNATTTTSGWRLRESKPDDLYAVLQIYDEAIVWLNTQGITEQWGTTPVSERPHLVKEISDFLHYGMVAEDDQIQGFIAVNFITPDYFAPYAQQPAVMDGGYVHTLVARRMPNVRGVGADLLGWAEKYTRGQGKAYLRLDCWAGNPKLIAYYESRGFVRCGEVADGNRLVQLFEKQLSGASDKI